MVNYKGFIAGILCLGLGSTVCADDQHSSLTALAPHWCLTDAAGHVVPGCKAPSINTWQANTPNNWNTYYQSHILPLQKTVTLNAGQGPVEIQLGMDTAKTVMQMLPTTTVKALGLSDENIPVTDWQHIIELVYFGGYVNDGQVLAPTPGWINAAHRHGVKILGTIFFNTMESGGNPEFNALTYMLTPAKDGSFPVADKLIAIAKAYGFDGYFLNEELNPFIHASQVQPFIKYFHKKAASEGLHLDLDWYVSTIPSMEAGVLQDSKTHEQIADHAFIDYSWQQNNYFQQLMNVFHQTTYPIKDMQFGVNADTDVDAPSQKSVMQMIPQGGALAEFDFQNILSPSHKADGNPALQNTNENNFWQQSGFKAPLHTSITSLPFLANFNTGQGLDYFIEGNAKGYGAWNDIAQQDDLPTYANKQTQTGAATNQLTQSYDYSNAYTGGSSLQIKGQLVKGAVTTFDLYAMQASMANDLLTVVSQSTDPQAADVSLCLTVGGQQDCYALQPGDNDWHDDMQVLAAQGVLTDVSLKIIAKQGGVYQLNLGQLYVGPQMQKPASPIDVKVPAGSEEETVDGKKFYHTVIQLPQAIDVKQTRVYYQGIFQGVASNGRYDLIATQPIKSADIQLSNVNAAGMASDLVSV